VLAEHGRGIESRLLVVASASTQATMADATASGFGHLACWPARPGRGARCSLTSHQLEQRLWPRANAADRRRPCYEPRLLGANVRLRRRGPRGEASPRFVAASATRRASTGAEVVHGRSAKARQACRLFPTLTAFSEVGLVDVDRETDIVAHDLGGPRAGAAVRVGATAPASTAPGPFFPVRCRRAANARLLEVPALPAAVPDAGA